MSNIKLPHYLLASFIFAAVNYHLVWNYEDASQTRRGKEEAKRLFGMAPPKHQHRIPSSAFVAISHEKSDDDLSRHDDGSLILLDSYENDDSIDEPWSNDQRTDRPEFVIDTKLLNYVNEDDAKDEHDLELSQLSRDINEFLYDSEDSKDDDGDMLTYFLRKRDVGFKKMAKSHNMQGDLRPNTNDIYLRQRERGFKEMAKAQSDKMLGAAISNPDVLQDEELVLPENPQVDGVDEQEIDNQSDDVEGDAGQDDQFAQSDDGIDEKGEKKFNVYSHRPKQNRTGSEWGGWPQDSHPDPGEVADADSENYWWRNSKQCFEVDSICHTRSTNSWFYYEPKQPQKSEQTPELFQPSMELRCEPLRYDRGLIAEERVNITVDASSKLNDVTFIDDHTFQFKSGTCKISSVPTHMTLQSMFNFMIGEFYARTLLPLHRLMTSTSYDDEMEKPWEQDIQFYVHTAHGNQILYDGHKLLLSGMLARENSAEVKSIVDLFSSKEESASSEGDCECFEKMVFCGYDTRVDDESMVSSNQTEVDDSNQAYHKAVGLTPDKDAMYTLWGASTTADDLETTGYCGKSEIYNDIYSCDDWADLRQFLLSNFAEHYPSLESDVINFRRSALLKLGFVDDNYNGNSKEWKFVGLAQRSYRRSWINLSEIMHECNKLHIAEKEKNVVCIEINVEKTTTPYEQLLLHQSIDALIGVHGAQLTQAVLLPRDAHVLELLPWVPDYIRGRWVQTRHTPTPLGIIFHNTDLNHLGYSLGRDSVPLCEVVAEVGSDEEKDCFMSKGNRKQFIWESRDFNVKLDVIMQYINQFLLAMNKDNISKCNSMENALDDEFVLYNVWCATNGAVDEKISHLNPNLTLRHFYDKDSDLARKRRKKKKQN